jgi:Lrp/AsnC family leucine-responsive transcriptional regulator
MRRADNGPSIVDAKDSSLLTLLQQDASMSLSELGRKVGLSKMAVSNRIRRLKRLGVIEASFLKLNPEKVGQDYIIISRAVCSSKGIEQEKIAGAVAKLPGVQSVYLLFGTSDILLIARRKDKAAAKKLIYDIAKIPGIRNTVTSVPHTIIKESLGLDFD